MKFICPAYTGHSPESCRDTRMHAPHLTGFMASLRSQILIHKRDQFPNRAQLPGSPCRRTHATGQFISRPVGLW